MKIWTLNIFIDYPRCTEYVDDMIRITQDLIDKNHAYTASDGVYFHVESAPQEIWAIDWPKY